jgi:tRNA A-37 threonylcarbamoyl transferase component Bud32
MEVQQVLGGRYELMDPLGGGGMAVVWRARDQVLGRTVAVKLLAGRHVDDPQSRELIRAEARAAAALSHPNIAQVYDYGESHEDDRCLPYVVMELVRGGTLEQRMAAGPLPPRFAMRVSAEVAAALAAAHSDGLVHRDVKPANVMVTPVGAKVVDFGIAAAIGPAATHGDDFEVLGTPAYLAPERLTSDAVEPACDVYALGVLLYRLLSGHSPWTADTTTQMLTAHIYIEPTPLPQLPEVPDYVTTLCNRCLSKDPTLRPSAREAAALLAQGAGLRVVEDEPAQVPAGQALDGEPSVLIRRDVGTSAVAPGGPALPDDAPGPTPPRALDTSPPTRTGAAVDTPALTGAAIDTPALTGAAIDTPAFTDTAVHTPALTGAAVDGLAGGHPDPATPPADAAPRRRRVWLVAGVAVLIAAGIVLWLVVPGGDRGTAFVLPAGSAPALATSAPAGATEGVPAIPVSSGAAATHGPSRPAAGAPKATTTTEHNGPGPTAARTTPGPTTTPDSPPQERTLSSSGGSVRAICPSATTAELLSWTPTKPYKVDDVNPGPGSAPTVVFRHGNRLVQMTVTCSAGVPSTLNEES